MDTHQLRCDQARRKTVLVTGSCRFRCKSFSGHFMPTASLLFTGSFRCFGSSRLTFSLATVGHGSTGCRCSCSTFAPPFPGARVEAEALNVTALSRSPRTSSGGLRNAYLLHDRIAYDSYIKAYSPPPVSEVSIVGSAWSPQ